MKLKYFYLIVLLLIGGGLEAQQNSSKLTLERIFNSGDFRTERFGPARWLSDGESYTTLEMSQSTRGRDIVRYNAKTGEREVFVPAERLIPQGKNVPLWISDYQWSNDGRKLLVFTNTKKVWRYSTRGDYWVVDLDSWKMQKLGEDAKASSLMFAKFSPDASRVAYVSENNIYVENILNNETTQLTTDGSTTLINGTFDWAYEEEFDQRDGFRWSPDGENIAFWQIDAEGIKDFLMINYTDSLYSYVKPVQYPKVGERPSSARIGVVSAKGGDIQWMKLEGDPHQHYIVRMDWAGNSKELMIQQLNRKQNTNKLLLANASEGTIRLLHTEKEDTWIDLHNDLRWLQGGNKFLWLSETDGWKHVYIGNRGDGKLKRITPWDLDVISIQLVDEKKGWMYFIASPDNPTQRFLYRSRLNGKGSPQKVSPENLKGTHQYQISTNGKWAIHTYSNANTPAIIDMVSLPNHQSVRSLVDNKALKGEVAALNIKSLEFFRVDIGNEVKLDGWIIKPVEFDPTKKYPVLFYVYGEPWNQTVLDRWDGWRFLWHQFIAQQGYVVISVDNRGTPAPRGSAWRKSIYGQIGILASSDQAAAALKISEWGFIDKDRLAIWGHSGGGAMTLNALFRYPDIYKTGMSVAPVTDQRLYDNIYQERYMGLLSENADGYKNGSPITYAKDLKGNLLLVHGTGDDNVHYQNSERLINELIRHNKPFSMMAYPNRSHGIFEGENTTLHLRTLLTNYLKANLEAGPKVKGVAKKE
ncbi:S9 family peptidase [Xanthovirga aplysinae]|uniref:S9 family peptidase n=1 Tax=Xanthovirga aplysinae TaxID=2529853 RepID=UPI0012BD30CD|nr:S9 family peptidase [Xanthovirga aplysinae]MTI31055.1 S9 family peptidase [Xanthovirga aplysinae]